jgi:hypothetical protein
MKGMATWKEVSEVTKNVVQIIAILMAGIWTYLVFVRTEGPLLEARASAQSDLVWYPFSTSDACLVQFSVRLDNIGKTSFRIDRVRLRAWSFDREPPTDEGMRFLDLEKIQANEPDFTKEYRSGPFIQRYAPSESFHHTFEWVIRRREGPELFLQIDFFEGNSSKTSSHTGKWSPVCQTRSDESDSEKAVAP